MYRIVIVCCVFLNLPPTFRRIAAGPLFCRVPGGLALSAFMRCPVIVLQIINSASRPAYSTGLSSGGNTVLSQAFSAPSLRLH